MSLKEYTQEKMAKMSLIDLTKLVLTEEKEELKFKDVFTKVADLKGLSEAEKDAKIGQYYTDLNVDGNFITNGANMWGLKSWYKDQKKVETDEGIPKPIRVKRRKKPVEVEDELESEFAAIDKNIDEINELSEEDYDPEESEFELDIDEEFLEDEEV
ncbi:MAG TPA: DNA-directed RNA polymerase subunit delta [Virgibacillus sp.]|nr:DNA-directed RNA polymerase subunit delta [Virgibacillus sp.]